jgi:hypothetical protein
MVSSLAYLLGHSIVIVCTPVNADGVGLNHIWDKKHRPPNYTRWSTGKQTISEPLVPMGLSPRRNAKRKGVI